MDASRRLRRPWLIPVFGVALLAGAAGCGSAPAGSSGSPSGGGSPSASSSQTAQRQADAPALVVDCVVVRGLPLSTGLSSIGRPSWMTSLGVQITPANQAEFNSWYQAHQTATVAGQSLAQWQQATVTSGKLPSQICGANGLNGMSVSDLQKQVFAKDPAVGDPW